MKDKRWLTFPYTLISLLFLAAKIDNKVVFPAPEGPMIANIYPGAQ
jgi:hypothetical protein